LKEQSDYEALDRVEQDLFMEQWLNDSLGLEGYPQVGLCGPGIPATLRRGSYLAVNSFGWTEFEIDAVTQNLTVTTYGIHRYDRDLYDSNQPNAILDERNPEVVSRFEVTPRTSSSARPVVGSLGDCATDCLPGAKCLASQDCCGSNVCDVAICVPRNSLSNGSPCSDDAACQSGVCDFAVCVPPNSVPDDYPCDDGAACQSGVCYLGLCGCQETLDACGDGGDCCHGYDVCNVHACVGRSSLPVFAPCNTHGACRSGSCTAGTCDQVCGDGDCDGVEQCGDDNSLFECNLDCERCDVGSLCQENSDCWTGYCTLGLCAPCLENQSLCLTDDQCCSGACSGVPLTCERLKGNGTRCVRDGQCSSGNCCNLRCRGCSCLGDPCSRDRDCCSNNCFLDRCAP
jgi:hypothetical protein